MTQRLPLIVVLGATACGKSKLAIELARRFGGEIISADSMQVYLGLDIVTNKVTQEERQQAKHHLIDFLDPLKRYSVVDFRNKSLNIINDLMKTNKLPIVVGGTNYYIESILWKNFIMEPALESAKRSFNDATQQNPLHNPSDEESDSETLIDAELHHLNATKDILLHNDEDLEDVERFFSKKIYSFGLRNISSDKLWQILEKVDPRTAHILHPNDRRKVVRSLQVIQDRRRNYSDILDEVNRSSGDNISLGGSLRYQPTCVMWLDCLDMDELDEILDARVDQMIERNLLGELEQFHKNYNKQRVLSNQDSDYQKGIFQAIGFKEFHNYLILDESTKVTEEGKALLQQSIENMKLSTRKYARRQLKWIRRRFMQSGIRDLPLLFRFQSTFDTECWNKSVFEPACAIVESIKDGKELTEDLVKYKQEPEEQAATNKPAKYFCEDCDRVLIGSMNIEAHLKSRRHYKTRSKKLRDDKKREDETSVVCNKLSHSESS